MTPAALLAATVLSCGWAAAPSAPAAGPKEDKAAEDKILVGPSPVHWLKVYSMSPYREFWSLDLSVKSLDRDLPKVREAFVKAGASLTQPFGNLAASTTDKTQQLSYRLSGKGAKAVLKKLRKLGALKPPIVRPSMEPVSLDEVKEKQRLLQAEHDANAKALAAMPSVSALVEEVLHHLATVRSVRENEETETLVNLTVRQAQ